LWWPSLRGGCLEVRTSAYRDAVPRLLRLTNSRNRSHDALGNLTDALRGGSGQGSSAFPRDLAHITEVEQLDDVIASQETEEIRRRALMIEYEYLAYTGEPVPAVVTENMTRKLLENPSSKGRKEVWAHFRLLEEREAGK